ncbi:8503_t:CDS:2, partial [Rhizophagus irregularis]
EIYSYEKYMVKYEGKTMERIPPILEFDDKEIILITHDECIFYSNDGKRDHQENPFIPKEACVYLQPSKDREGYWTSKHLINQIKTKAIPIFETLFPNCIALFAFDNSSNHAAFKPDALVANKMNLKPGGKQPKMRIQFLD